MFDWLKKLLKKPAPPPVPVVTPEPEGPPEPTLAAALDAFFAAREEEIRIMATDTHSDVFRDKLHSRADEVAYLRAEVKKMAGE